MANQRVFLWAMLAFILYLCYQAWMTDYHPSAPRGTTPPTTSTQPRSESSPQTPLSDTVPRLPATAQSPASSSTPSPNAIPAAVAGADAIVRVVTDVLDLDIGLTGGILRRADLRKYPKDKKRPDVLVRLFDASSAHPYVFQSGLTAQGQTAQPDHLAKFAAAATEYRLADGQDTLAVPLTWTDEQGLTVTKTFTFKRGNYGIDLDYDVRNGGQQTWNAAPYMQFLRHYEHVERSMWNVETYAFKGPALWDGSRYTKLKVDDEEDGKFSRSVTGGWLAAMQHHFVGALVPPPGQAYEFKLQANKDGDYLLSAVGPTQAVPPGGEQHFSAKIFVGPKLQNQLVAISPELDRTADYGHLTIIAKPLFNVLEWVHRAVGNWGWTIVIVTFLIKLAFYPLSEASGRSMAKMRILAPRIKNLQERYKDNREQLGRAMMDIYKKEKINPLAGCLPMLVQIPVFLAFYWTLLESVEMRQAPFMLWINDLSSRDPFFILPLLMGAAMFAQFKLNPAPPDPMQAKIFMIMPIVMTVMFAFFPSGLVLYWLTNTLLSIAQQWNINRRIGAAKKAS